MVAGPKYFKICLECAVTQQKIDQTVVKDKLIIHIIGSIDPEAPVSYTHLTLPTTERG